MSTERPYFCTSAAVGVNPIEVHSIENQRHRMVLSSSLDLKDEIRTVLDDVPNWLPIASEVLGISPSINDYILTPIISMPSDLPNKNGQSFPYQELTKWQPEYGCPSYKTWNGMPSHFEHQNSDPTLAKGIILNTLLRPIANTSGDIYKVIKLVAWDRNRDSVLANDILSGKRRSYSMGAYARNYSCSICNALLTKGGCDHVALNVPAFKCFSADGKQVTANTPGARLAYHNIVDMKGFEISSVSHAAYLSGSDANFFTLENHKDG